MVAFEEAAEGAEVVVVAGVELDAGVVVAEGVAAGARPEKAVATSEEDR